MGILLNVYVSPHLCMWMRIYVRVCVCMSVERRSYTHTHTHTRVYQRLSTHRQVLLVLQRSLFLPETVPELADPLVHGGHLQVAFVQVVSLLLQLAVLLLVQLVPHLGTGFTSG